MKNRIITIALCVTSLSYYSVDAQSMVGLWSVTKVSVGTENMTPVAKWFEFTKDGIATGGNGWTQNSIGKWIYDNKNKEFSATNDLGIKDEFGPFKVSFLKDTMRWTRQEEGMNVTVSLVPIKKKSPAEIDLIKGLWSLIKVEDENGIELTNYDPSGKQYFWTRPDMRFQIRNPDESLTRGFWHMHGHRPLLTLINYDRSVSNEEYVVSFKDSTMTMRSRSETKMMYHYVRINEFPNE